MNEYESLAACYAEILRLMHEELEKLTDKEKRRLRPIKTRCKENYLIRRVMRYKIETLTFYRVRDTETNIICHAHLTREEARKHIKELDKENGRCRKAEISKDSVRV